MPRPRIALVSPALADANNGNWQTARRWRQLLAPTHAVRIVPHWPDAEAGRDAALIALHARRSADAIRDWARERGPQALAVVLTGTDLYHDIFHDRRAKASLALAQHLVVLQDQGLTALPPAHRAKARVIYQSTGARAPVAKSAQLLRVVMVGHMRSVKSPQTFMQAARLLADRPDIRFDQIGDALDPEWAEAARRTEAEVPGYRWLGGLSHGRARLAIARAHVLVNASAMEGGAHVILEAVRSGTPVLASRVSGNVGMLGTGYGGYFPHDDAAALASLVARCRDTQADPAEGLLARLHRQCDLRAPLFEPEAEAAALRQLLQDLLTP